MMAKKQRHDFLSSRRRGEGAASLCTSNLYFKPDLLAKDTTQSSSKKIYTNRLTKRSLPSTDGPEKKKIEAHALIKKITKVKDDLTNPRQKGRKHKK